MRYLSWVISFLVSEASLRLYNILCLDPSCIAAGLAGLPPVLSPLNSIRVITVCSGVTSCVVWKA